MCYFASWASYRQGSGEFGPEDVSPHLCTHVVYQFAKIGSDSDITAGDPYLDLVEGGGLGAYKRAIALKQRNLNLKVMIAIGGWLEDSTKYTNVGGNVFSLTA